MPGLNLNHGLEIKHLSCEFGPMGILKLPGRDRSWMGDYATCGSCNIAHAARLALAPRLLQRYDW